MVSIENGGWFVVTRSEKRTASGDARLEAAALLGRMAIGSEWSVECKHTRGLVLNLIVNQTKTVVQPFGTIFAN